MNNQQRKPVYATLMSLFLPGFGQLYNGELNKAIWIFLAFSILAIPGLVTVALHLPGALMLPALIFGLFATLAVWFYGISDAWKGARHCHAYVLKAWQLSGVYVLVFLLGNIIFFQLTGYVRAHEVQAFKIPSKSMEPTIQKGDFIFADKRYNCPGCKEAVQRGDIAIFTYPNNRTLHYLKRIIGLPGDHIRINGDSVWVNGKLLTVGRKHAQGGTLVTEHAGNRQWQVLWTNLPESESESDITVPPGQVFVLGDNRNHAKDSRTFGSVPLRDVVGKARQIWFSWAAHRVRWDRLGTILE